MECGGWSVEGGLGTVSVRVGCVGKKLRGKMEMVRWRWKEGESRGKRKRKG